MRETGKVLHIVIVLHTVCNVHFIEYYYFYLLFTVYLCTSLICYLFANSMNPLIADGHILLVIMMHLTDVHCFQCAPIPGNNN